MGLYRGSNFQILTGVWVVGSQANLTRCLEGTQRHPLQVGETKSQTGSNLEPHVIAIINHPAFRHMSYRQSLNITGVPLVVP